MRKSGLTLLIFKGEMRVFRIKNALKIFPACTAFRIHNFV